MICRNRELTALYITQTSHIASNSLLRYFTNLFCVENAYLVNVERKNVSFAELIFTNVNKYYGIILKSFMWYYILMISLDIYERKDIE